MHIRLYSVIQLRQSPHTPQTSAHASYLCLFGTFLTDWLDTGSMSAISASFKFNCFLCPGLPFLLLRSFRLDCLCNTFSSLAILCAASGYVVMKRSSLRPSLDMQVPAELVSTTVVNRSKDWPLKFQCNKPMLTTFYTSLCSLWTTVPFLGPILQQ